MDKIFLEEERRIDLASIKKIDRNITQILDKTDNVAFYRFDGTSWHKQDIHGSIFVFSRSVSPYYGFTILNRKSLHDNVIELLIDGLEFQRCDLYLLYKTCLTGQANDTGIKSIWFEDEAGCMRISTLLHRLLRMRHESPTDPGSANILHMFEKCTDRVRQSASPDVITCSPGTSPPYRHNNKRNNSRGTRSDWDHNGGGEYYRNEHDYRTNHDYRSNNTARNSSDENSSNHQQWQQRGSGLRHMKQNGDYNNRRNQASPIPQSGDNRRHPASPRQQSGNNRRHPTSPRRQSGDDRRNQISPQQISGDNRRNPTSPNLQLSVDDRRSPIPQPVLPEGGLLNLFSMAHKRFSKESESERTKLSPPLSANQKAPNKAVTIMKRGTAESNIVPGLPGLCKSKSGEKVTNSDDIGTKGSTKRPSKDLKTIPITFQDLVNSVQPKSDGRPLSCYSIEGSTSSSAEEIVLSSGEESTSVRSSNSDPAPSSVPIRDVTKQLAVVTMADSAKLLMSPLDFKKGLAVPIPVRANTPAKRSLFEKKKPESPKKPEMSVSQFKELLIASLEDDDFAGAMFNVFTKKVKSMR